MNPGGGGGESCQSNPVEPNNRTEGSLILIPKGTLEQFIYDVKENKPTTGLYDGRYVILA